MSATSISAQPLRRRSRLSAPRPSDVPLQPGSAHVVVVGNDLGYTAEFRGALISALVAEGHRVTVICPSGEAADVRRLLAAGARVVGWPLQQAGLNPLRDTPALLNLVRLIRELRPDILFAHTMKPSIYGLLAGWLGRVPRRVVMFPGLGYAFTEGRELRRNVSRVFATALMRLALPHAHAVIFQNNDDVKLFLEQNLVRGGQAVRVHGSGVDLERFAFTPLPSGPTTYLMVARMLRDKGIHEYVEAARRVRAQAPETRFLYLGGSHPNPNAVTQAELQAWREEGVVEFMGWTADVIPWLQRSHAFVLPSYYGEGIPRSILEAMASGRAIVTTDSPGCRETVEPRRNGLLVRPRDPAALADALLSLSGDHALLARMGARSRRLCEERYELGAVTRATMRGVTGDWSGFQEAPRGQGRTWA